MLSRRRLLAGFGSIPFIAKGLLSSVPLAQPQEGTECRPCEPGRYGPGQPMVNSYIMVRASSKVRAGDVVFWDGVPVGIAVNAIDRGHYGFAVKSGV